MKNTILPLFFLLLLKTVSYGQTCNPLVSYDGASFNSSNFTVVNQDPSTFGSISLDDGFVFDNVRGGRTKRAYTSLPTTLSDTKFSAECDVHVTSGFLSGVYLMSFMAGTLPTTSTTTGCTPCAYPTTDQDAISVILTSQGTITQTGARLHFWSKSNGGVLDYIFIPTDQLNNFKVRFERTSLTTARISAFTNTGGLIGTQTYQFSNQTSLNTFESSIHPGGASSRVFSGKIDNIKIHNGCNIGESETCDPLVSYEDVSFSPSNFTVVNQDASTFGSISLDNGFVFDNVRGGRTKRAYTSLPTTLSDTKFYAECDVNVTSGFLSSVYVMSFMAGTLPTTSTTTGCTPCSYPTTNQDAISVILTSQGTITQTGARLHFWSKSNGGVLDYIFIPTDQLNDFKVRFERTSLTTARISAFTSTGGLIGTQTYQFSNQTSLNTFESSIHPGGASSRVFSGKIDNIKIYNGCSLGSESNATRASTLSTETSFEEQSNFSTVNIYPNPTVEYLFIESETNLPYTIYDFTGNVVIEGVSNGDDKINISGISSGTYIFKTKNHSQTFVKE